jgi:alcohol dehydrogenase
MLQQVFEQNGFSKLKSFIKKLNPKKVFIVHGNKSYKTSGAEEFINALFAQSEKTSFSEFKINPDLDDLKTGVEKCKAENFDLIVAIGGGSVLDMAKLISILVFQETEIEKILFKNEKPINRKIPLLAIPTTAGSGAETTHFTVIYENKTKYSWAHTSILPDFVYLSSDFLSSASPYQKACSGADAFCQAIESVWSVNANAQSEEYALKSIKLILNNLVSAVKHGSSESLSNMQRASYLAGKAINITKTTAPHAISYAFTSYYNIPHGHAVALSLPYFFKFNYHLNNEDCTDPRGFQHVRKRMNKVLKIFDSDKNRISGFLEKFFNEIGINTRIMREISNFDPTLIIENVNTQRLQNNPRKVTKNTILELMTYIH